MRYGSYPLASTESWYAQNNEQQGTATTDLSSRDKCVYATDVMFNTESYTIRKAYTAASIITHAQSKAVKQAHIRTSSLMCNNYYKLGPSNTDLTPAKPITNNYSRTKTQKSNSWELRTRPALYYPSNSTGISKQTQGRLQANVRKQYPNEESQQEESNATTLTSIGAVYHRQSEKIRFSEQYLGYRDRDQQSGTKTQKSNSWELRTRPALYYPSNSTGISKQTQGRLQANVRKQYPNEESQQEESNATTLTSIGAVYRRQSEKIRFNEQYLGWMVFPANYRATLVRILQVVTICRVESPRSWLYGLVLTTRNIIETLHDYSPHFDSFTDSVRVIRCRDWVRSRSMWESMPCCRGFTARPSAWISYAI
ncbi:hypothetical protein F511_40794 [Dorcoceras hygrometricum]|uniref:Uncharacterized protein n=1 Tax=Dorcoceras hygrometricum TaxID=472368 RepID=A0A2Z7BI92_9LAMI|nr:hypothetical protein F511_40794 [Dorcoceras hygrometricum]